MVTPTEDDYYSSLVSDFTNRFFNFDEGVERAVTGSLQSLSGKTGA